MQAKNTCFFRSEFHKGQPLNKGFEISKNEVTAKITTLGK